MIRQAASPIVRQLLRTNCAAVPSRNAATKVTLRNTMDDLPIPSGSWETQYKANQTKYNMHLALGIIFTTVTVITGKTSGLLKLYNDIPELPKE